MESHLSLLWWLLQWQNRLDYLTREKTELLLGWDRKSNKNKKNSTRNILFFFFFFLFPSFHLLVGIFVWCSLFFRRLTIIFSCSFFIDNRDIYFQKNLLKAYTAVHEWVARLTACIVLNWTVLEQTNCVKMEFTFLDILSFMRIVKSLHCVPISSVT